MLPIFQCFSNTIIHICTAQFEEIFIYYNLIDLHITLQHSSVGEVETKIFERKFKSILNNNNGYQS